PLPDGSASPSTLALSLLQVLEGPPSSDRAGVWTLGTLVPTLDKGWAPTPSAALHTCIGNCPAPPGQCPGPEMAEKVEYGDTQKRAGGSVGRAQRQDWEAGEALTSSSHADEFEIQAEPSSWPWEVQGAPGQEWGPGTASGVTPGGPQVSGAGDHAQRGGGPSWTKAAQPSRRAEALGSGLRATGPAGDGVAQLRELLPPGEMAERGPRFLQAKEGGSQNPGSPVNHSSASAGSPPTQAPSAQITLKPALMRFLDARQCPRGRAHQSEEAIKKQAPEEDAKHLLGASPASTARKKEIQARPT
ncbi:hypothetical protein E2I00_015780, partial [Balaenoptera physalus]